MWELEKPRPTLYQYSLMDFDTMEPADQKRYTNKKTNKKMSRSSLFHVSCIYIIFASLTLHSSLYMLYIYNDLYVVILS